jgi:hypothetical protein
MEPRKPRRLLGRGDSGVQWSLPGLPIPVATAHRPILPLMLYNQTSSQGVPNDREALDAACAEPIQAGWGTTSTSCSSLSCSHLGGLDTTFQELFNIGIQRYLIDPARINWYSCAKYVVLAALSAIARLIALLFQLVLPSSCS